MYESTHDETKGTVVIQNRDSGFTHFHRFQSKFGPIKLPFRGNWASKLKYRLPIAALTVLTVCIEYRQRT